MVFKFIIVKIKKLNKFGNAIELLVTLKYGKYFSLELTDYNKLRLNELNICTEVFEKKNP